MKLWPLRTKEQEQDERITKAEKVARDHARRLRRLEAEVGIIRPTNGREHAA